MAPQPCLREVLNAAGSRHPEGGTKLPASQRETTWVSPNENNTQGARITNWRRPMHVMDNDPFYVVA